MLDSMPITMDTIHVWIGPIHLESSPAWSVGQSTHSSAGIGKVRSLQSEPLPINAITPTRTTCVCLAGSQENDMLMPTCGSRLPHKDQILPINARLSSSSALQQGRKSKTTWKTWEADSTRSARTSSDLWRWSNTERYPRLSLPTQTDWCDFDLSSSRSSVVITGVGSLS